MIQSVLDKLEQELLGSFIQTSETSALVLVFVWLQMRMKRRLLDLEEKELYLEFGITFLL